MAWSWCCLPDRQWSTEKLRAGAGYLYPSSLEQIKHWAVTKMNQKIKIGQFSISAWLEARFSSYDQKTVNLGKQVYTLPTGGFCTVQLCLLFIDGATGCFYLPSTFDPSSLTLNEQLRRGSWWQAIYTFFRCRIWILFQIHWSRTGSVGIFPPL